MAKRLLQQYSLADSFVRRKAKSSKWLEDIEQAIDWRPIETVLNKIHSNTVGAPAFPPLPLFKILLLQQWYGLSDEAAEAAVDDRLSFRRFCGFPLDQNVPDHSTIWRFREALSRENRAEAAFDALNAQLERRGLIIKRGTLVDATIIQAAAKSPKPGEVSQTDPDAGWTCKNGETTFGYKCHAAVDEDGGLIRQMIGSSASFHDSLAGEPLIQGDEQHYYADKAYDTAELRNALKQKGIEPRILHRARRNAPLSTIQKGLNAFYSSIRFQVERPFAFMKRHMGYVRARYFNLARNNAHFQLIGFALNLKRVVSLQKLKAAA